MSTSVSTTASPRAKLLFFAAVAVYAASSIAIVGQTIDFSIAEIIGGCSFLAVGALLVFRRPGNVLGPLFVVIGTGWNLVFLGIVTADNFDEAGRVDAASWVSLLAAVLVIPMLWLNSVVWLLFPDGHTHSVAARRLLWGTGALTLVLMAGAALGTPRVLPETKQFPNPFVGEPLASTMFDVFGAPQVILVVLPYVAAGMLLARMRHADPITRRQIGWVASAILVNITLILLNVAVEPFGTENRAFMILDSVSTMILMGAMAIAIMKFRLYEIDRIISRSVTFGVLAVFIGGVYVGIVVGVRGHSGGGVLVVDRRLGDRGDRIPASSPAGGTLGEPARLRRPRHPVRGAGPVLASFGRAPRRRAGVACPAADRRRDRCEQRGVVGALRRRLPHGGVGAGRCTAAGPRLQ